MAAFFGRASAMGLILSEPSCIHVDALAPTRRFLRPQWAATFDNRDDVIGWGGTKDAAVSDLIEQADELCVIGFEAGHALPVREMRT